VEKKTLLGINMKLKALILAGGKSSRMGMDKGKLQYFDDFQTKTLARTLGEVVDEVYVSVRAEQIDEDHIQGLNIVEDIYPSVGPIAGIMSAMDRDKEAAWLVLAVDLPHVNSEVIKKLVKNRDQTKSATCFKNPQKGWPEPLCTIWEPRAKETLVEFYNQQKYCPRKVLFNMEIKIIEIEDINILNNCNTVEDYQKAKKIIEARL
jgi:molybdopterin-guanine dinucleotide biosynthesis protein A